MEKASRIATVTQARQRGWFVGEGGRGRGRTTALFVSVEVTSLLLQNELNYWVPY